MYVYIERLPDDVLKTELLPRPVNLRQLARFRTNAKIKL